MNSVNRRPTSSAKSTGVGQNSEPIDLPSGKYGEVFEPSPVLLRRAAEPAHPVLPRQTVAKQLPPTMRERIPLAASLTGAGRAGKIGCLTGSTGSKYKGNVMAGRPHGKGQYYAPAVQPGKPLRLVYEGDFVQGARQGQGTCYYNSGEVYTGAWLQNKRTGQGKLSYVDGSVYDGMWRADRRHGVGTFYSTNGDIFVGSFVEDKRHGLGTTYMPSRGKKYVAEYVADSPKCGNFFELEYEEVEAPPTQQLRNTIAAGTLRREVGPGELPGQMPVLQLVQPAKVLAKEFVVVRQQRSQQLKPADNTLPAQSMSLLRHAFILIAGGDDLAAFVLPHQLQELMVLAGLDPAAAPVVKLLGVLQDKARQNNSTGAGIAGPGGDGRLTLDEFMHVVAFFRDKPLAVLEQEQAQQAAAEAAARAVAAAAAAAAAGEDGGSHHVDGQQGEQQETWQHDDEAGEGEAAAAHGSEGVLDDTAAAAAAAASGSEGVWGVATDDLMLERHIAQHRAGSAGSSAGAAALDTGAGSAAVLAEGSAAAAAAAAVPEEPEAAEEPSVAVTEPAEVEQEASSSEGGAERLPEPAVGVDSTFSEGNTCSISSETGPAEAETEVAGDGTMDEHVAVGAAGEGAEAVYGAGHTACSSDGTAETAVAASSADEADRTGAAEVQEVAVSEAGGDALEAQDTTETVTAAGQEAETGTSDAPDGATAASGAGDHHVADD